jgi:hypothetical protein
MEKSRPGNVTTVCYFFWLHALAAVAAAVALVWLWIASYSADGSLPESESGAVNDIALGCCSPCGAAVVAALFARLGWGLWQLRPWARRAGIAVSGVLIALSLLSVLTGNCGALFGTVLYGLVIWQLSHTGAKAAFEPRAAPQLHPGTRATELPASQPSRARRGDDRR